VSLSQSIVGFCYQNGFVVNRISNVVTDAAVISHEDWKRIKKDSVHLTAKEHAEIARRQEIARQATVSEIQTKRLTLISPDLSPDTTLQTHSTLATTEKPSHAVRIAERKADEELDEISYIRGQMVAAEARTVRDGQLAENAALREAHQRREREWAAQLEANRREAEQHYADREASLNEQQLRGRVIISA
jgi:hypothetical protein